MFLDTPAQILLATVVSVLVMNALLLVLPFWIIYGKAGFSRWYSLAALIPFLGILLLFMLAVVEWPALRQVASSAGVDPIRTK